MKKIYLVRYQMLILSLTLLCISALAQNELNIKMLSPKLRQFITTHPGALHLLTNSVSGSFSNKTVQLYYFYSEDESTARSFHYYPDESVVGIMIRENQLPVDEFTCFIFESINSEKEKAFQAIFQKAVTGELSKTNFVHEIMSQEFNTARQCRNLLQSIKFNTADTSGSFSYNAVMGCPDTFEDFLVYKKKVSSPKRDQIKEYESAYDSMRANNAGGVQTNSFETIKE